MSRASFDRGLACPPTPNPHPQNNESSIEGTIGWVGGWVGVCGGRRQDQAGFFPFHRKEVGALLAKCAQKTGPAPVRPPTLAPTPKSHTAASEGIPGIVGVGDGHFRHMCRGDRTTRRNRTFKENERGKKRVWGQSGAALPPLATRLNSLPHVCARLLSPACSLSHTLPRPLSLLICEPPLKHLQIHTSSTLRIRLHQSHPLTHSLPLQHSRPVVRPERRTQLGAPGGLGAGRLRTGPAVGGFCG